MYWDNYLAKGTPWCILLLLFLVLPNSAHAQEDPDHHAQSDAYWAQQAQAYPAFVVDPTQLRVAAANELNQLGEWGPVLDWPHIPVSAAHLPDGRILTWASNEEDGFPGGQAEFTYAAAWDPSTEAFKMVPHNTHDMFCAHQVMLEDGRLLVMGGRNTVKLTSIYDYKTDTWIPQEDMADSRWYPTSVAMPNGEVMVAIGSGGSNNPEMWNELSGWRKLTGIDLNAPILNYTGYYENNWWPLFHVAPNGEVFHSGPTPDMHYINTAGNGSITQVGPQITDWYPKHGTTVMYDEGKILTAGGAIAGGNTASTNRAMTIDITNGTPVVTEVAPMAFARKFQSGVPLPTGEVLVIGGNTSGIKFNDTGSILTPEIFNPETGTWTQMADMAIPRNYHSVALLMTDGRVWSGGGGLCGSGCAANHMDAQIFSPPYLFNSDGSLATRPVIDSAPVSIRNGELMTVTGTAGMTKFSAIKMSSTTHGVDSDVRYLSVPFVEGAAGTYDLTIHSNENVMTPGHWMLFGINDQGVPSEAAIIQISTEGIPDIANPGTQVTPEGNVVSLFIVATDSDGGTLSYSATGLPTGLSLNGSTGEISGTVADGSAGSYNVSVSVSDGTSTVDTEFLWVVTTGATGQILREWWSDISGTGINLLTDDPDYPDNPDGSDYLDRFEAPTDWADNYGTRVRGYLHPPVTGDYTFWIATDDNGELWLSTDEDPANKTMIANVPGWSNDYEWYKFPEQQSSTISLVEGQRYYVEVLQKEGGGLDNIAVAWQIPGGTLEVIEGAFLSPYSGAPIVDNPGDQLGFKGDAVNLTVTATDPENDPLSFSATGLPDGLSINGDGLISGTIGESSASDNSVEVTATDGISNTSVSFNWTVLTPAEAQGEIGNVTVSQDNATQWHTVNLDNTYSIPVVVMGPPSYAAAEPLTVRVRNVSSTSFEFQLDEWDYLDGAHGSETLSYMVLEYGSHTLNDGRSIQAGFLDASGNGWSGVSFSAVFNSTPVVISQTGTANDGTAVTTRHRNVGVTSFEVQLEEEEGSANDHGTETIYWVAIESGTSSEAVPNEAGITADVVEEIWHTISFNQSYSASPVFLGAFQTADGGDPATMRYQNLSSSSVDVFTEEEQAANDETGHTTEVAGYIVFDEAGPIPFEGFAPPPIVLTNPGDQSGAEGEAVSLALQVEEDNGDPLTWTASGLPSGLSINSTSGLISGGLVAGGAATTMVTVDVTDGLSNGSMTFTWNINPARGSWIDYTDDSAIAITLTSVPDDDGEEKDVAIGDLNKDGLDDIIVVRKAPFMETEARADLLLMNESGTLVDRTTDYAPGFAVEPTIARDAIITDLDGDGWDDVLIANTFGDQPKFYRNLGADASGWLGLADESTTRLPTLDVGSIQYCGVAAGDVNGDGAPDLYFSNYVMDGTTKDVLLINDGNGNFTDEGNDRLGDLINVAFGTQGSITDMDGDGDNDIVKLSANQPADPFPTDGIYVLYNDGTGNFSTWSTVPSTDAYMYIMGDFDNNDEKDFYIVDDAADYVNLSTGVTANSNINFSQQTTPWVRTAGHGANLRIGDLDRDGDLDIGVADVDTSFPPCEATDLRAFLLLENEGDATGTFIDPFGAASKPWNKNMYDFAFIDVNNDGNLDIFSAECSGYGLFTSTQDPVEPPVELTTIALGDLNLGVAAHDPRTGTGYIMYSEESVHSRFASDPPSAWAADHLIAAVFENGAWHIDRNKTALVPFTPRSSDRLLVEIDFGANTANHLEGINTSVEGINAGYVSGDLVVTPEMWGGNPDNGEFGVVGTEVVVNGEGLNSSPVLAAIEDQFNYIDDSYTLTLSATDSDGDPVTFSATDLPPGMSVSGNEISGTLTAAGIFNVVVTASDGKGGVDNTSFAWTVDGGDPTSTINLALGDLNLGIAAHDQRTGNGYIMYSEESIHTRFADNPPSAWNADHLIAVVFDNGEWKIDRNKFHLVPFTPLGSDHLLASVDFSADIVTHLTGVNTVVEGINAGMVGGDLVITAEMWGGSPNAGEFGVEGTTVEIPGEVAQAAARGGSPQILTNPADEVPEVFDLSSIYPNPFSGTTTVEYHLPEESSVRIEIFNITGQRIKLLIDNGQMQAGTWNSIWDGTDESDQAVAAGVYIIRFQADGYTETSKVVLIK